MLEQWDAYGEMSNRGKRTTDQLVMIFIYIYINKYMNIFEYIYIDIYACVDMNVKDIQAKQEIQ